MSAFSPDALERPARAIQAYGILRAHAGEIGLATSQASRDEQVVVVVTSDLSFAGIWTLPLKELTSQLPDMEAKQGWTLLFEAHTPVAQIEDHCLTLARLSFKRWEAMQRFASRQHPRATPQDA
jgi:hypothetical protein